MKYFRTCDVNLSEAAKVGTFQACPIFKDLSPVDIRELSSRATGAVFEKGASIFKEGDPAYFFYLVHGGLVRIHKTSGSGKDVTFTIATRGDTLIAVALSIEEYFVSAQAMNDATVLKIGSKEFLAFVSTHVSVAMGIMTIMSQRLDREYGRILDIVGKKVELRLIQSLCLLADKFGPTLSLTRQELADFAGTTTETTIRVLSKLKKKGVISCSAARGEIVISDLHGLRDSTTQSLRYPADFRDNFEKL